MKIDLEYMFKILNVFLKSDNAHININDIQKSGINIYSIDRKKIDEKFLFHIQNIVENKLISNQKLECNELKAIGITLFANNSVSIMIVPIRLTQKGYDFVNALSNKNVLKKLKSDFKNMTFKMLLDKSQEILENYI